MLIIEMIRGKTISVWKKEKIAVPFIVTKVKGKIISYPYRVGQIRINSNLLIMAGSIKGVNL